MTQRERFGREHRSPLPYLVDGRPGVRVIDAADEQEEVEAEIRFAAHRIVHVEPGDYVHSNGDGTFFWARDLTVLLVSKGQARGKPQDPAENLKKSRQPRMRRPWPRGGSPGLDTRRVTGIFVHPLESSPVRSVGRDLRHRPRGPSVPTLCVEHDLYRDSSIRSPRVGEIGLAR
jgi:hypothetical protein